MAAVPHIPTQGILQNPAYKTARFMTEYVNVPISMHRLRNAIGLTAGLYLGRKLMNIVVGETPEGQKIHKEDLPDPLKPLHGLLPYDHFSDDPSQRWMRVFDLLVPAVLGGIGACAGGAYHFRDSFIKPTEAKMGLSADKFFLADAEQRALYQQSKPWSTATGTSALFGSASGLGLFPSIAHYGGDLGTLFAMRAERSPSPLGHLVNSHSHIPMRPHKLINQMIEYAAGNPAGKLEELDEYANGILKAWFKDVSDTQVKDFVKLVEGQRAQFLKEGRLPEEAAAKLKDTLHKGLQGAGLEKTFIKVGLDPRKADVGNQGFISVIANTIGDALGMKTSKHMEETRALLRKGMEARNPELAHIPFNPQEHQSQFTTAHKATAGTLLGLAGLSFGAVATAKDTSIHDLKVKRTAQHLDDAKETKNDGDTDKKFVERVAPLADKKHQVHSKVDHGFLNGKALDMAEGVTDMFNVVTGMNSHRLSCALGLTAGSWLGEETMKALTGFTFTGVKVQKADVLKPLQKFYKALAFNPHSDLPHDRWMQLVRWAVPTLVGAAAVVQASDMYFNARKKKFRDAKYLDEIEAKATSMQADPWSYGVAATAIYGGSSGFAWIPGINYMTHLGTRFSMASGRKVALPQLGKVWSNNDTLFPFGPPGMLDMLIREAVNNKSYDPELLETYAIGILKPWFDNVKPEQVEAFVMKVHEVRDQFYREGGVPEEAKKKLEEDLKLHFKGAGLEETLEQIGLHPTEATIANNGLAGKLADAMGSKKLINKLKSDYVASYVERHKAREHAAPPEKPLSI
ncbi:MAG: hypothetical protein SFT92_01505 [Rickettsiales bacterium]|nr:hypothetical protein [Rickettsiales bacterium]